MELPKDQCYTEVQTGNGVQYQCKICGRILCRKQRILTHLLQKHHKSPLKRVYKAYEDDPTVPIPKRTALRHSSSRNRLFSPDRNTASDPSSDINEVDSTESINEAEETIALHSNEDFEQDQEYLLEKSMPMSPSLSVLDDKDLYDNATPSSSALSSDFDSVSENDTSDEDEEVESFSDRTSDSSSDTDSSSFEFQECDRKQEYTETEVQAMCIMSIILSHNLSGVAADDMLKLLPLLLPSFSQHDKLTYQKLLFSSGKETCKSVDYCSVCNKRFPDDPEIFTCETGNCDSYRYKGPLSAQQKAGRQPKNCFLIANVEKQLAYILGRKGIWKNIQDVKKRVTSQKVQTQEIITDVTDGKFYHHLCEPGQFLDNPSSVSAIFNTDGIPLYNSSNVKLWPIFLAINELPPNARFARENMVLAAIWQGKNKPPFAEYIASFGEEMHKLYYDGFILNTPDFLDPVHVKFGVLLGTMDLQAKGYVLNMTMHNGQFGCSTCEEEGESVKQGKGYARSYPYRPPDERPAIRDSENIKQIIGPKATNSRRVKGICGMSGLASMSWFDIVLGIVPDYMHGILLGVTKTLLYKFFSPTNNNKPYFIGKHLKKISQRLQGIFPPDYIERMPRDLEKNYNHFKATELQTWLIFYAVPCLNGFLDEKFLRHLSLLCDSLHLLLGDNITEGELQTAEAYLNKFYEQFTDLYGKGSCGLNVHNIGAHLVFYVRMWGPLWAWSCFPFEDWNSAILQSVHGTGDVTKQCLRLREIQLKLSCLDICDVQEKSAQTYLRTMRQHCKLWSCGKSFGKVSVAGSLQNGQCIPEKAVPFILECTGAQSLKHVKKALRVKYCDQKLYSQEYTRMKKRLCHIVRCKNGDIKKILYFVVNTECNLVFAIVHRINLHNQCFIFEMIPCHIIRVIETDVTEVIKVEDIAEKVFLMHIDGVNYITYMPNMHGHGVFK